MWWDEGHKRTLSLSPPSLPSFLLLTVPIIWTGTHGRVPQWQVPETRPDHPNPSSHIHSGSDNSWCAGSFPASPFIHSGIRVSLFVLVKWGGRAGRRRQVYTARWTDFKQGPCTNTIKHFLEKTHWFPRVGSHLKFAFLSLINEAKWAWNESSIVRQWIDKKLTTKSFINQNVNLCVYVCVRGSWALLSVKHTEDGEASYTVKNHYQFNNDDDFMLHKLVCIYAV